MKFESDENKEQTFWVSYADLMAGLLFIFMLIIGAVVVKYLLSQNELASKEQTIIQTLANLQDEQGKNISLESLNELLKDELNKLGSENLKLKNHHDLVIVELDELKKRLKNLDEQNALSSQTIITLRAQNDDLNTTAQNLQTKILLLDDEIGKTRQREQDLNATNTQNSERIVALLSQISDKDAMYSDLLRDLNATRDHIKNLTGIRIKVIAALKERLGDSIAIDANSGALKLSSSVLFDKASAQLKESAKEELKNTLQSYFDVLLSPEIAKDIDQIIIEGFTDSDGSYIYNLELSQKRAYEVMNFIATFNDNARLRELLVASGRSFNELVMKDGREDQDASRRIEIKFQISNKQAMHEIQKILERDR